MNLRPVMTRAMATIAILTSASLSSAAQVSRGTRSGSATHVAAELTKGRLSSAESKPGDNVEIRLKDDLRSNGEILLRRGTTITGVVRNVKRIEGNSVMKDQAQSMMEIEWLAPAVGGKAARDLSIALQSVLQLTPLSQPSVAEASSNDFEFANHVVSRNQTADVGLLTGMVRSNGQSNTALLKMPSVVAADRQTAGAIENALGASPSLQLFKVGRGAVLSSRGSRQTIDIFSHLNNDTVITSENNNFEISSGADMQLLVGVNGK